MKTNPGILKQWEKVKQYKSDLFIDVGAGLPYSEAYLAKRDWGCEVIGFEPHPERFKNLKNESYFDKIYNFTVSNKPEDEEYWDCDGMAQKWVSEKQKEYSKKIKLQSVTIDMCFHHISMSRSDNPSDDGYCFDKTTFIWADIEGMELEMLQGATRLLKSGKVTGLNLEVRDKTIGYPTFQDIKDFLKDYNFKPTKDKLTSKHEDIIFIPC